jgi:hypothetical protein
MIDDDEEIRNFKWDTDEELESEEKEPGMAQASLYMEGSLHDQDEGDELVLCPLFWNDHHSVSFVLTIYFFIPFLGRH